MPCARAGRRCYTIWFLARFLTNIRKVLARSATDISFVPLSDISFRVNSALHNYPWLVGVLSCQLHEDYPSVFNIARDAVKAIRSARYAAIKVMRDYSHLIGSQPQTFVRLVPKGRGPSNSASTCRHLAPSLARSGINAGSSPPLLGHSIWNSTANGCAF